MSAPPTEAGELVSNNSLFSDSVEFDRAEKPITDREANELADDFNDPNYSNPNDNQVQPRSGVIHLYPEDGDARYADEPEEPEIPDIVEENAPFMKKRNFPLKDAEDWVPIEAFRIPGGDAQDEFGLANALKPVKKDRAAAGNKGPVEFFNGEPDMEGNEEITNCFDEPGLLYRIINKRKKTWAFYNDSLAFEINVVCTFGPQSKLEALDNTRIHKNDKKEIVAEVTVYPGETEMFVKGFVNGFTSKLRALPLSEEYYEERTAVQNSSVVQDEIAAVRDVARAARASPDDSEAVLRACIDANTPFVDLSFPPVQSSIEKGNQRRFKTMPWARPKQYLRDKIVSLKRRAVREGQSIEDGEFDDQIRLFRRPVVPGSIDGGELGDCWLQCAVATLCENETAIINMFRHPQGAEAAKAEQKVGAYRVTFNKNGLWRSVIVDNYFPVVGNKLKFARIQNCGTNDEDFEIWPAVLQKAYAKLHGSYAAIMSGDPVHALTDLTGAPSYRFDDAFNEATVNGGSQLFSKLEELASKQRYQVILTTPGKAPAIVPGSPSTDPVFDFTEEPQVAQALRGTTLLPGHAYTVLQAKSYAGENVKLIQVRNPWPYTFGDEEDEDEAADWGEGSALWQKYPNIAKDCGMTNGTSGAHRRDASERAITRWFSWSDALRFFAGGGVVYQPRAYTSAHDVRVPITFADCRPGLMFELAVSAPLDIVLTLSNVDHKSAGMNEQYGSPEEEANAEYPPVMLSLAIQNEKHLNKQEGKPNRPSKSATDDVFRVVLNSSADVSEPSESKWTFLQAREIGMKVRLTPEDGPYYLIPRLMEDETTMGGGSQRNQQEFARVDTLHFENKYAKLYPEEARECAERKEVPVTIGFVGGESAKAAGLRFRKIAGSNSVFENFPKFPTDGDVAPSKAKIFYQSKEASEGFPQEKSEVDFM